MEKKRELKETTLKKKAYEIRTKIRTSKTK
jgi:hypothetical protein